MKGGKLIGEGSYGCVYRPPLHCKGELKRRPDNVVSKLMLRDEAFKELVESDRVHNIDKEFKYHLPPHTMCIPAYPTLERDNLFRDCELLLDNDIDINEKGWDKKLRILQMKDGGDPLSEYLGNKIKGEPFTDSEIQHFLRDFHNIIYGLKEMSMHKYLHFDIKSDNIVIKKQEGIHRFNYIDFGLSIQLDDFNLDELDLQRGYFIRPIEVILFDPLMLDIETRKVERNTLLDSFLMSNLRLLLSNVNDIHKMTGKTTREIFKERINKIYSLSYMSEYNKKYIEGGNLYLDNFDIDWYIDFIDTIPDNIKIRKKVIKSFIKEILMKSEVFSMGILFIEMWNAFTRSKFNINEKPTLLSPYMSSFYDLIMDMIKSRYTERISIAEVYDRYKKKLLLTSKRSGGLRGSRKLKKKNKKYTRKQS